MSNKANEIIFLASDHNGVGLKAVLTEALLAWNYVSVDLGPYDNYKNVDYVDYAKQVGNIIQSNDDFKGILICGTGVGMSIVVNKFPATRAALVQDTLTAAKCREHNNSNVLCLGSWNNDFESATEILRVWLQEPYGEGRHNKRLSKIPNSPPEKIVFTNGVFDILHKGHIELLRFSKRLGDKLVVAINSDASVRSLKGESRPVNNEEDRKKLLESLREIDEVVIFDGDLASVRECISPQVIVKGGEWTSEEVRQRDNIPPEIEVTIFPIIKNYSTTSMMKKIQLLETCKKDESEL